MNTMKIGELSAQSGISASRIRFYEANALLPAAERQANGYRSYGASALQRLAIIDRAQQAGFSLDEIRAILPADLHGWHEQEGVLQMLRDKLQSISAMVARLNENKRQIQQLIHEMEWREDGESCSSRTTRLMKQVRSTPAPSIERKKRR